ncbi:MAG: hypothetical protein DRN54_04220 [Thaumarchaeota archaeon]|nr:MAG: hypothetical protein DRN54_04220 [Nitrososphaerota archaeon]
MLPLGTSSFNLAISSDKRRAFVESWIGLPRNFDAAERYSKALSLVSLMKGSVTEPNARSVPFKPMAAAGFTAIEYAS